MWGGDECENRTHVATPNALFSSPRVLVTFYLYSLLKHVLLVLAFDLFQKTATAVELAAL